MKNEESALKQLRKLLKRQEDNMIKWTNADKLVHEQEEVLRKLKSRERKLKNCFTQTPVQLINELVSKVEDECKRKEEALQESVTMNGETLSTLVVRAREAIHEILWCRKAAIEVLKTIKTDNSEDHIDKASEKKKLRDKSTKQQLNVGIQEVGLIDEHPRADLPGRYEDENDSKKGKKRRKRKRR